MEHMNLEDSELVSRLRRLDTGGGSVPGYDYEGLLQRQAARASRRRRRAALARGGAGALVAVMLGVSTWHLGRTVDDPPAMAMAPPPPANPPALAGERAEQRLVRADTWLALAALEEHIATIDDALTDARVIAPHGGEVARLERTRAELLDSYVHVRYADMVAANF